MPDKVRQAGKPRIKPGGSLSNKEKLSLGAILVNTAIGVASRTPVGAGIALAANLAIAIKNNPKKKKKRSTRGR
jgi:hypothetical protein